MLVHSYMTDGFLLFGKVFLESFKKFNGTKHPVLLTTRNLDIKQINSLFALYPNLHISNTEINMEELAGRTKFSVDDLLSFKKQCETRTVNKASVVWKQFVSVEDRYRKSLPEAALMAKDLGEKYVAHFDIDSLIRKDLKVLFKMVQKHDVSLIFRKHNQENMKIFGSLLGWRLGVASDSFFSEWGMLIDSIPLMRKPRGYGQTSCWRAFLRCTNLGYRIDFGEIPQSFTTVGQSDDALIWAGNRGGKLAVSKKFEALSGDL